MAEYLLTVENLQTIFHTYAGNVQAVRGISFNLDKGESLGIVGESGCGKSVSMLSILHLLDDNAESTSDDILLNGRDISGFSTKQMRKLNGKTIGMIFQDPMTSLNPVFTIEQQIVDPLIRHLHLTRSQARDRALELLNMVGIPDPSDRLGQYPHELSGGLRQRVMIAIAMSCKPELLIADEPTTALDVTVQAQILELIDKLREELHTSVILISHDFGVVSTMCTRVLVMYGGEIVEEGSIEDIIYNPRHPYTHGLLDSIPKGKGDKLVPIYGTPPDLINPPMGCPFAPRCKYAMKVCNQYEPPRYCENGNHSYSCWLFHPSVKQQGQ
jgi:oligopeptide transport system ATP-binding protein